ncbi:MAG: hypothetical protein A3F11_04695 [Gammaproteobacteria bacterium RIFCSPHIGHO2_12_FULL_37_14]|nr:MAG: hypothetical protein A3F11_04695 [Gammaproteobacteria bacterium RIFCSPHIGHO2_12_FULL_37_14]
MDINFIIVLLMIFLLIVGPFIGIMHLRDKARNQQLAYRLNTINRVRATPQNNKIPIIKKQDNASWIILRNIILFFIIPIPALFMILLNDSIFFMFVQVSIYFGIIFVIYFSIIKIRENNYKKAFNDEFPNAIDQVIRNLRAGRTIIDSIKTAGEDIKGPVSEQFRSIVDQVGLGKDFILVINDLSAQLNIPEFTFFGIVLSVQQETGGNIIKTLSSLVTMLRGRHLMRLKVKALSSEGIMSAIVMGGLPFVAAGVIYLIRPDYFDVLFITSAGQKMLIISILCELIGCIVILRTLHIEV